VKDNPGLERLLALARRGRPAQPDEAPLGFATRVASRAHAVRREDGLLVWERLAMWGAACAIVLCVLTATLHRHHTAKETALADFAGLSESAESPW
jgi:hypothetical protein